MFFFFLISHVQYIQMGASRENFSSKWVYPAQTFLQNGCIQGNVFYKKGASSENFSSKWVHSRKTFAAKLMHQDKNLLQNGCIKSISIPEFGKRIMLSFKVSLHIVRVSLLMWFSLKSDNIPVKVKSELWSKRRRSVKGCLSCWARLEVGKRI